MPIMANLYVIIFKEKKSEQKKSFVSKYSNIGDGRFCCRLLLVKVPNVKCVSQLLFLIFWWGGGEGTGL